MKRSKREGQILVQAKGDFHRKKNQITGKGVRFWCPVEEGRELAHNGFVTIIEDVPKAPWMRLTDEELAEVEKNKPVTLQKCVQVIAHDIFKDSANDESNSEPAL